MTIRDLAIGGIAGAALAAVATHYLNGAVASPSTAATAPMASASALPATAAAPQAAPVPPGAVAASQGSSAATTAAVAPGVACPPAVAAVDPKKMASATAPAAGRVDVPAITLSAEHAKMLLDENSRPPSLPELHARFAGEPLDPAWSQQMEAQLRQALQDAGVQKGFELLAVECRRTLCELRLFGTGPDVGQRWGAISAQLGQQPWWGPNFSGASSSTTGMNDRSVIATILHRAKH